MKGPTFLLTLLLACSPVMAEDALRHIEVTGQAEVRRAPDRAVVTVGVETWNTDLVAARQENGSKVARLLGVPTRFNLAPGDVRTDFASVQPEYDMGDRGQVRSISGYRVTQVLSFVVRDLKLVDAVVTAAFGAGANRLDGVTFGLNDPTAASTEARILAVRSARAKAETLAGELGVTVGKPLLVSDGSADNPVQAPRFKAMAAMAVEDGTTDSFAPGQIVVSAQVNVWFELKD